MRCPFCGSTDIGDIYSENDDLEHKRICLDCEKTWVVGGRRHPKK